MNTPRHLPRPVLLAVAGSALAGLLTACAGSTADNAVSGDPAVTTTPGASPTGFAPAPTAVSGSGAASAAPTSAAPRSSAPAASAAPVVPPVVGTAATMPAVTGATNLRMEPKIAAGKKPAPTRLLIRDLVVGKGAEATGSSTVSVQYVGANYANGKTFDASWTDTPGQPASFSLAPGNVIQGFSEGIAGMKVGGRREIVIPPSLGYGQQANGPIVANETLTFVVDLVKVG